MPRARVNGGILGQISATGGIRTATEAGELKTQGLWVGSNIVAIPASSIISTVQYLTPAGANTAVTAVSAITGNTIAVYGQNFDVVNNVYLNNTLIPNTRVSSSLIQANVVPFIATTSTYVTAFNGVTADTVSLANSAPLSLAGTSWTIECWVNPTGNYLTYNTLFAKRSGASASYEGFLNTGNGYIGFYNGGTIYLSTTVLTANVWSHCAWVYNGSSVTIYVNGVSVYNTGAVTITDYAVPLAIGSYYNGAIYQDFTYGSLSNFRVVKGVAVYTGNFIVPAMPLATSQTASTNIAAVSAAQTSLLTLQSITPADNSINTAAVSLSGNPTTTLYSLFGGNTYNLSIFSATTGVGAIYYSGVQFQAPPVWTAYNIIAQPNGAVNYQLAATGATSYYLTSGDLSGLSLSTSGLLTGTYSAGTPISVVVTAYNAYGLGTPQTVTVTPSYAITYLAVGGGGGGGSYAGGGGGGGGYIANANAATSGITYIIGVGSGGLSSSRGGNSYISGGTLGNIVAVGGGAGGSPAPGGLGGSGGGGGAGSADNARGSAINSPGVAGVVGTQGYPGGQGQGGNAGGGGGGGAGGSGTDGQGGSGGVYGGPGGIGALWPINNNYYSGGGGGGGGSIGPQTGGGGGTGGGGAGGPGNSPAAGVAGTALTGGGGGGGANNPGSGGGAGGSGVVFIAYPNAPGIQYASGGNLAVTNGYYLHTFTSPGTYTAVSTPSWITSTALTTGVNQDFAIDLIATDVSTVTYYLAAGNTLPTNTSITTTGVFSGNVPSAGSYSFYVNATNRAGGITPRQFTLTVNNSGYTINYLAVGGGGAGGSAYPGATNGAGGGAGGFLTGQITVPSPTTVTAYTITVGAGGMAQNLGPVTGYIGYGLPGGYSNISAPTITTIAALGGGGGGGGNYSPLNTAFSGQSGASGGGGGAQGTGPTELAGQAGLATGSPGLNIAGTQGFPGGFGVGAPGYAGGGGGGAGGAGRSAYQPDATSGVGGVGLASSITGTLTYYAGGGTSINVSGGLGGGGAGATGVSAGTPGTPGTGGGGGGGANNIGTYSGGAGGSGTVVLRMPTASFSGNYTPVANTTVANVGSNTILTFTTSGTYVSGPNSNAYAVQYLVVAGGGAGGTGVFGSGGGAGGVLAGSSLLVASTAYPIAVGTGGVTPAGSGTPSTFNGLTAIGGGFGAANPPATSASPGGSGGGGASTPLATPNGIGVGVSGQGYPGGVSTAASPTRGAGGGGAGAMGGSVTNSFPAPGAAGPGGAGYTWPVTGSTYAGGGGGAQNANSLVTPGGTGGGGAGGSSIAVGGPGTPGKGGGGGGGGSTGGPGVVVIAYQNPTQRGSGGTVTPAPSNPTGYWLHTFPAPGTYTA